MKNHKLDPNHSSNLTSAKDLLAKLDASPLSDDPEKRRALDTLVHALEVLPKTIKGFSVLLSLVAPYRTFGDHRIKHYWEISLEENGTINITAGGYYSGPAGGDSFSSMIWESTPGQEPLFTDLLDRIKMVDDAEPFDNEVQGIDLTKDDYIFEVEINAEPEMD